MIETTIRTYLAGALPGVPVFLEMPEVPSDSYPAWPDRFVLIEKVGGSKRDYIDTMSFAFQSYSLTSLYGAASLDKQVRQAVEGLVSLDSIASVRLASNYNFTDTAAKRYRYQATYDFVCYED